MGTDLEDYYDEPCLTGYACLFCLMRLLAEEVTTRSDIRWLRDLGREDLVVLWSGSAPAKPQSLYQQNGRGVGPLWRSIPISVLGIMYRTVASTVRATHASSGLRR